MRAKRPSVPEPRKRGRPPTDPTPNTDNPAFRRVSAAKIVQECFHRAAIQAMDGSGPEGSTEDLRDDLLRLVPIADLRDAEQTNLRTRAPGAGVALDEIRATGGPAKWADAMTGVVLGHGRHWYRDAVERSPWPPGKLRRFATDAEMKSARLAHPRRFDKLTPQERCFSKMPAAARNQVERELREKVENELSRWPGIGWPKAPPEREKYPFVGYFGRDREDLHRGGEALVPEPLRQLVSKVLALRPERERAAINRRRQRRNREGGVYYLTPVPPAHNLSPHAPHPLQR